MRHDIIIQTPLNNNIRELFNLMNFLDPDNWNDLDALEKDYEELTEELVKQLHAKLRPYFLRRIKSEVLELPPKVQNFSFATIYIYMLISEERGHCSRLNGAIATGSVPVNFKYATLQHNHSSLLTIGKATMSKS